MVQSCQERLQEEGIFDERGFMDRIKFVYQRDDDTRRRDTDGAAGSSTLKGRRDSEASQEEVMKEFLCKNLKKTLKL